MRYAVFDLGSNSIKCVMAETSARGVRVLHEESIGTRLAEHLIDTCELRPEAIARTLDALRPIRALERKQVEPGFSRRELKDLQGILKQIALLQINPEKGRRKDLKKIDALIGELQSTVERW